MGNADLFSVARYQVTKIFKHTDGKCRVPGDPKLGYVELDYAAAARLRSAGCIGGIVKGMEPGKPKRKYTKKDKE